MQYRNLRKFDKFLGLTLFSVLFAAGLWLFWDIPSLDTLESNLAIPSIRFTDRNSRTLYELIDDSGGRNSPVPLAQIPDHLQLATIATEDQNFYRHPGIDFTGILRAFLINLQGGETLAGGSTITQQVAKNLLLSGDEQLKRTLRRKLRESWLAWRITHKYSREEILSLYLNQMYYGAMAYGVEAASQTYFGHPVSELNLAECALIAGIPQAPALYNPFFDPDAAITRQHIVLELMHNQSYITQDELDVAIRQPLTFTSSPYPLEAPHFVMMVIAQLDQLLPDQVRNPSNSLVVRTTLDLDLQHLAEKAITKHLNSLGEKYPTKLSNGQETSHNMPGGHNVNNAALVALDPKTGGILSLVGSPNYFDPNTAGAINMANAPRQPGSALKPIIYAAAFTPDHPNPLTAASMILDVKTSFVTNDGHAYIPANFDNLEHGPVSARQALASSLNIPAVVVLDQIGLTRLFNLASELGISTFGNPEDYDLSLALGGGEVTLLELSAAYGAFANDGNHVDPFTILDISTIEGEIIYQHTSPTSTRILDERVVWLISDILNDNEARTIGFGVNSALRIDRPVAVKTGTTTNFHDNWTIGYTPDLVTGVWVGNANHEPMRGVTGLSGAGPIWHQFMREALTGTPKNWFSIPEGLVKVEVCSLSGLLPTNACPYKKYEWFIQGTEPVIPDSIFQKVWIDRNTGMLATSTTLPENRTPFTALDLPPQAHPWARENDIPLLVDLKTQNMKDALNSISNPIEIISPGDQSIFLLNSSLSQEEQKIHIQVASPYPLNRVDLWLDGKLLTSLYAPTYETWWQLEIGTHSLWAESHNSTSGYLCSSTIHFKVESAP